MLLYWLALSRVSCEFSAAAAVSSDISLPLLYFMLCIHHHGKCRSSWCFVHPYATIAAAGDSFLPVPLPPPPSLSLLPVFGSMRPQSLPVSRLRLCGWSFSSLSLSPVFARKAEAGGGLARRRGGGQGVPGKAASFPRCGTCKWRCWYGNYWCGDPFHKGYNIPQRLSIPFFYRSSATIGKVEIVAL